MNPTTRPRFRDLVLPLLHFIPELLLLASNRDSCISAGCEFRLGRLLCGTTSLLLRFRFLGLNLVFNQTRALFIAAVLLLNVSRVLRGYACLQQQFCVHKGVYVYVN